MKHDACIFAIKINKRMHFFLIMIQFGLCLHFFKELASADNFQFYLLSFAMIYVNVYRDFSFFPETIGHAK